MKSFFKSIPLSVYSKEYYKSVLAENSLKKALLRMLGIVALVAIVPAIAAFFAIFAFLSARTVSTLTEQVPANLDVEVRDGRVISHGGDPFVMPLPQQARGDRANIFVVDTQNAFSEEAFERHDAYVVIGPDYIAIKDKQKTEIIGLDEVPNLRLNQATVGATLESVAGYRFLIALGIGLIAYLFAFSGLFVGYGIWMLIGALLVMLVAYLKGLRLTYKQSYIVGLHASTLPLIIDGLSVLLTVSFPLFTTIITLVIVACCLPKGEKGTGPAEAVKAEPVAPMAPVIVPPASEAPSAPAADAPATTGADTATTTSSQ